MKSFLEEYGVIIVAVIAVAALIAFATNYSKSGTEGMGETFDKFQQTATDAANNSGNNSEDNNNENNDENNDENNENAD